MSFLGLSGLLGLGGGDNGTGQTINNPTTPEQLQGAYQGSQNSLQSQQALLQALQAQNGLGNQSQVFNQLQGVANGTGPNPAQAMLNQATGQNVANQAALMAGQRGATGNVGLMARQAAQQGAGIQQNAAGQGATLQANQSLNAINSAGNIANTQAANQIAGTTANTQATQSEQSLLNNANAGVNNINGQLANTITTGQQGITGGLLGGIGAAMHAKGGMITKYADGGSVPLSSAGGFLSGWSGGSGQGTSSPQMSGGSPLQTGVTNLGAGIGRAFKPSTPTQAPDAVDPDQQQNAINSLLTPDSSASTDMASSALPMAGDVAPIMESAAAYGGKITTVGKKLKSGGHVPGKPKVPGNSYSNDTVKALLSPGEVVIPNSVMQSGDPVNNAAKFVQQVLAKKGMGLRK